MADVYVTMCFVETPLNLFGGSGRTEVITSSGTAASGSLEAAPSEVAKVFCATAVMANADGTASATAGIYCEPGVANYIRVPAGNTISVIDV